MSAQYYPHRVIGIVEGPNYGGKTTAFGQLKQLVPSATIGEFHDYYHHQAMRLVFEGNPISIEQIQKGQLTHAALHELVKYNQHRLYRAVEQMAQERLDPFLWERFHITDLVYRKLIFDRDDFDQYGPLEERLNKMGAFLMVLTTPDDVILGRMQETQKPERQKENTTPLPYHLTIPELALRKRDLYVEFFERSAIVKKRLVISRNGEDYQPVFKELLTP